MELETAMMKIKGIVIHIATLAPSLAPSLAPKIGNPLTKIKEFYVPIFFTWTNFAEGINV